MNIMVRVDVTLARRTIFQDPIKLHMQLFYSLDKFIEDIRLKMNTKLAFHYKIRIQSNYFYGQLIIVMYQIQEHANRSRLS